MVLLSAAGAGTNELARAARVSKTVVWRWQQWFMEEGIDGFLRDKIRPSCIAPLSAAVTDRAVALSLEAPPGETAHWRAEATAKAAGMSVSSAQRVWRTHGPQPHRLCQFKPSNDRQFAAKVRAWLRRHPRLVFQFAPTSASRINAAEGYFPKLTRGRFKRAVSRSIVDPRPPSIAWSPRPATTSRLLKKSPWRVEIGHFEPSGAFRSSSAD